MLFYQHHLRSPEATVGPSGDRYRFRANELLNACLDLTVVYYEASTEYPEAGEGAGADVDTENEEKRVSATATIVARNSHGGSQSYPESHWSR